MTTHISSNTACNLGCTYCYEHPSRQVSQQEIDSEYDVDAILERADEFMQRYNEAPGFHGGEPLMVRIEDMKEILEFVQEKIEEYDINDTPHIQTNGSLITDRHIELFKKYNVSPGVSLDGPGELNSARVGKSGGDDVTNKMTNNTLENIQKLKKEGLHPSIITVLNKQNAATDERLEELLEWMDWLTKNGIRGHFNPLVEYESMQYENSISKDRMLEAYIRTWEWMKDKPYRVWDPIASYADALLGLGHLQCNEGYCDGYNTNSARLIMGDGGTSGCGKSWDGVGDGKPFLQGPTTGNEYGESYERYDMLKNLPGPYTDEVQAGVIEDQGGCKGCPYWSQCHGGCPGGGLYDDYRNRTNMCKVVSGIFEYIEDDLRGTFPGIRLVTDAEWDNENTGAVEIKPFAEMRISSSGTGASILGASGNVDVESVDALVSRNTARSKKKPERIGEVDSRNTVRKRKSKPDKMISATAALDYDIPSRLVDDILENVSKYGLENVSVNIRSGRFDIQT